MKAQRTAVFLLVALFLAAPFFGLQTVKAQTLYQDYDSGVLGNLNSFVDFSGYYNLGVTVNGDYRIQYLIDSNSTSGDEVTFAYDLNQAYSGVEQDIAWFSEGGHLADPRLQYLGTGDGINPSLVVLNFPSTNITFTRINGETNAFCDSVNVTDLDTAFFTDNSNWSDGVNSLDFNNVTFNQVHVFFDNGVFVGTVQVLLESTTPPTSTPTPTPYSPPPTTGAQISLTEIVLLIVFMFFVALAFTTKEPFLVGIAAFVSIILGMDLALIYLGNGASWAFGVVGFMFVLLGFWLIAAALQFSFGGKRQK